MMRHVDVPDDVARGLVKEVSRGKTKQRKPAKSAEPKYIPVVAVVNGEITRATLVPAGGRRRCSRHRASARSLFENSAGPSRSSCGSEAAPQGVEGIRSTHAGGGAVISSSGLIPLNLTRQDIAGSIEQSTFCSSGRSCGRRNSLIP